MSGGRPGSGYSPIIVRNKTLHRSSYLGCRLNATCSTAIPSVLFSGGLREWCSVDIIGRQGELSADTAHCQLGILHTAWSAKFLGPVVKLLRDVAYRGVAD